MNNARIWPLIYDNKTQTHIFLLENPKTGKEINIVVSLFVMEMDVFPEIIGYSNAKKHKIKREKERFFLLSFKILEEGKPYILLEKKNFLISVWFFLMGNNSK